jgi:hypothetical protein
MSGPRYPQGSPDAMIAMAAKLRALAADLEAAAAGHRPNGEILKRAPVLDCWSLAARNEPCLVGWQSGHPLLTGDGAVATSGLYFLDRETGIARTLSRWYRLGREQGVGGFGSRC